MNDKDERDEMRWSTGVHAAFDNAFERDRDRTFAFVLCLIRVRMESRQNFYVRVAFNNVFE